MDWSACSVNEVSLICWGLIYVVVVYAFTSIPGGLIEFNFFNVNLETISLCLAEETKIIGTTSWAGVPAALTTSWAGLQR